jgi:hypothetical protein
MASFLGLSIAFFNAGGIGSGIGRHGQCQRLSGGSLGQSKMASSAPWIHHRPVTHFADLAISSNSVAPSSSSPPTEDGIGPDMCSTLNGVD